MSSASTMQSLVYKKCNQHTPTRCNIHAFKTQNTVAVVHQVCDVFFLFLRCVHHLRWVRFLRQLHCVRLQLHLCLVHWRLHQLHCLHPVLLAIPALREFAVAFASTAFIALCAFALVFNCIACVSCVIMETRHKAWFPQNNAMQRNEMQSGFHKIHNTT